MTAAFTINALTIASTMLGRVAKNLDRIAGFMSTHTSGMVLASGPMRGGKTMTLVAVIDALREVPMLRIKPQRDDRQTGMRTHTGIEADAFGVATLADLQELMRVHNTRVIVADEWQFASNELTRELIRLAFDHIVIVGMLDLTFDPREWEAHRILREEGHDLLRSSFMHLKLIGMCQRCGSVRATHSALTVAPPADGSSVLTGADVYLTVCEACHTPPPA